MDPYKPRYVKMLDLRKAVRRKLIQIEQVSDDGEYIHFKILPNGPICGMWNEFGEKLMVVDRSTVHENMVKMCPDLFEPVDE